MKKPLTHILSIAGFDPSGGAGILADIKTFEQHRCIGMAVQTANTVQTSDRFVSLHPVDEPVLLDQLNTLLDQYHFSVIKIGLIPSLATLVKILSLCHKANANTKIIWDPVLSASAGFDFNPDLRELGTILPKLYLITPNWNEAKLLSNQVDAVTGAQNLAQSTKVLLKGGHHPETIGKDSLFDAEFVRTYNPKPGKYYPKHGTGCVLSSAIAANLAKGFPLHKSILRAKRYIEGFMGSHASLIGKHRL